MQSTCRALLGWPYNTARPAPSSVLSPNGNSPRGKGFSLCVWLHTSAFPPCGICHRVFQGALFLKLWVVEGLARACVPSLSRELLQADGWVTHQG